MLKIFIIEDDINIISALQAKFSLEGFIIGTDIGNDSNGIIMNKIKEFRPDYIISDLVLPYIDGFKLVRDIKGDPELARIPLIIFSDLSDEDMQIRGTQLGAEYYFIKDDFLIDEFVQKVKRIMENRAKMLLKK